MEPVEFVTSLYRAVLRREPDEAGLNHWVNVVNASGDHTVVLAAMLDSAEYGNCSWALPVREAGSLLAPVLTGEQSATRTINLDDRQLVICGNPSDPYFRHLNFGDHTNDFLLYVRKHFLSEHATVFDVGANIGVTAVILATAAPRGQVYAFEPGANTYQYLVTTIGANNLLNCHPQQMALGAMSGEAEFFSNPESESASHLAVDGAALGGSNARVKIKTVDELVRDLRLSELNLIKIDVEGFELEVLQGAQSTISKFRPHVFLEFNSFTLVAFGNKNPRYVLEQLRHMFPHVYRFDRGVMLELTDEPAMLGFIHDNMTSHGCVDDLFCTF